MVVMGLLASAALGLMALRGITMLFVPSSPDPFLFPLPVSIPLALAFGLAVTYVLGRFMGFYGLSVLRDYESRRRRVRREALAGPEDRPVVPESPIEY